MPTNVHLAEIESNITKVSRSPVSLLVVLITQRSLLAQLWLSPNLLFFSVVNLNLPLQSKSWVAFFF